MNKKAENFLRLKDIAGEDPQYREITEEYRRIEPLFNEVMEGLTPAQREAVLDYLWVIDWAGRYMTLLACGKMVFSDEAE